MSTTMKSNVVIPEVLMPILDGKLQSMLKLTQYAKLDTTLQGVAGDTVKYPSWDYIGDAVEVAEGQEVPTTALSTQIKEFTIKKVMKCVPITQEALDASTGDAAGQAAMQIGKAIASKIDTDVIEAAYTAPVVVNKSSAVIGYDAIVDAVTKFGDEEDGIDKVMFIHPSQEATLLKDDDFVSRDKFTGEVAVTGAIGKVAGCWIKKSNKVKQMEAVTAVPGVYTIKIDTKATAGDKITVSGVSFVAGTDFSLSTDTATGNATALTAALNDSTNTNLSCYTWTSSGTTITATEDTGFEGTGVPTAVVEQTTSGTMAVTVETTTKGVQGSAACYACPIIKLGISSSDTEYTDSELAGITIHIKRNSDLWSEFKPKTQTHEITGAAYYGVALTNAAKVIVAKFGK